jgi:glyoxylase-like metal-dependent hydrolase (beta-lactamase superfamily II)
MVEYEIYALKYAGPLTSSGAFMMWLKEWETVKERNYYLWCLKGKKESVVVDVGVTPDLAGERNLPGYTNPVEMLSRIGVKADEVRHVVISHLHWDHASGLVLFPNATFYIQNAEYRFWLEDEVARRPPFKQFLDEASRDDLAALQRTKRLTLLKGDQEIRPGVECVLSPGHSVALHAVAVNTEKGKAVLGSDCAHLFRNYREDWPSSLVIDLIALMKTYDKLRSIASSDDLIFPGHDPIMSTSYQSVAEGITRLV